MLLKEDMQNVLPKMESSTKNIKRKSLINKRKELQ